jgi:hypothetical protein
MVNAFINPDTDTESMTFYQKHYKQLELATSFDWLDFSALGGHWGRIQRNTRIQPLCRCRTAELPLLRPAKAHRNTGRIRSDASAVSEGTALAVKEFGACAIFENVLHYD